MLTTTEGEVTRAYSIHGDGSDVFVLKGPSSHILKYFDGEATLSEVHARLDKECDITGSNEDFTKMINFLLENQILLKK